MITSAFAEGGFYMGGGGGYSSMIGISKDNLTFPNGDLSQSGNAFALTAYMGYNFNHFIGIEANYLGSFSSRTNFYNATQGLLGGSVLLHLPFEVFLPSLTGFNTFIRGGYDYNSIGIGSQVNCANCINLPSLTYGYTPRFGVGAEYNHDSIGYRVEWSHSSDLLVGNQLNIDNNVFLASIMYHY